MPSRSINFKTDYSVEEIIEFNPSQPGRKPSVDYVLRGDMNGDVLFYTPVEAKKEISIEDLNQLSLYMAKVGTAKEIVEKCLLGYLIDRKHVQFAISPLTYECKPLPILFISNPIVWCDNGIVEGTCMALSLMQLFDMKRLNEDLKEILGADVADMLISNASSLISIHSLQNTR